MTFAALICYYFYPLSSKLGFVWIHHICFYRILEFTYVLTFLISSCRWLLTWSICQDKHLQQGTSTVLLWSNLYHWAAQTSHCIWSVKWKITENGAGGQHVCTLRQSGLECSVTLRFLVVFATMFSCIGKSKSTPISPSWCLYAGVSLSTTNGEENKKWNLQENRIHLFAGIS